MEKIPFIMILFMFLMLMEVWKSSIDIIQKDLDTIIELYFITALPHLLNANACFSPRDIQIKLLSTVS